MNTMLRTPLLRPRRLLAALLLSALPSTAAAQTPVSFGLGATVTSPVGELARRYDTGLGGTLTGQLLLDTRCSLTATLQQLRFRGTSANTPGPIGPVPDLDITALTGGVRSFLGSGGAQFGGVYLASELGWFRESARDRGTGERVEDTELGLLPTLGYATRSFDVSAQVKLNGRSQWLQLRGSVTLVRW
jgi:hypothetical protein